MGRLKELSILLDESANEILDHLDVLPSDRLRELMDRISFELMDRDLEAQLRFEVAESEYLDSPF